jgi:hypothetical protein
MINDEPDEWIVYPHPMTPMATKTRVSPESQDCNYAFLAFSSRWA